MKTNTMRTWLAAGVLGMAVVCAPHVAVAAEYWFDLNGATLNFGDPGSGDWSGTASNWNPGPVAVGTNQTVVWPNKAWPATPDNINFRNRNSTHFGTLANPNWLITVVGTQTIGRIKLDNTSVSRPMYIVLTNGVVSFQDATAKDVAASSNITLHVCSDMKFDATSTNPLSTEYSYQFYAGALSSFTPNNQLILDGKVYAGVTNKTYMYLWPIDKNSQSSKVILTPRCEIGNGDGMAMSMILGMHQAIWEQGGRVEISATNSYTGDTFLHGAITVLYTDAPVGQNGAFGNASSVVKIGGITPGLANGLYANCTATLLTGVAGLTVGRDLHVYYGNANNTTFGVIIGGEHTSGTSTFSGKLRLAVNTSWPRTTDVQVVSAAGGTVRLTGEIEDYVAGGGPAIKKIGLGTVLLSGASAYRGGTKVSQGTLLVNGTLGTGAVTVASAATLGGTGTIRGWVAAQTGSYLAPGDNGIGTLTVSNLTFAADSTYRWEGHSAGGDRINALVGATLPTAMTVTVSRLDSSELTSAAVLIDSATPIGGGNPANFTLVPAATYTLGLSGDGKQLLLRPPPKGSAILIL